MGGQNKKPSLKVLGGEDTVDYSPSNSYKEKGKNNNANKFNKPKIKIKSDKLKIKPKTIEDEIATTQETIEEQQQSNIFESFKAKIDTSGIDVLNSEFEEYSQEDQEYIDETEQQPPQFEDPIETFEEENEKQDQKEINNEEVSFTGALKNLFNSIFKFTGKTNKREYLYSFLWLLILNFCLGIVGSLLSLFVPFIALILPLVSLVISIANISLNCRRFNDLGMYWWTGIIPLALSVLSCIVVFVVFIGYIPNIISNPSSILSSLSGVLLFITIGGLLLFIESIWQLVLFIAKNSNSFKDKKITNYILIGLIAIGYIVIILGFILGISGKDSNTLNAESVNNTNMEQSDVDYTFGTESTGYITTNTLYNLESCVAGTYIFSNDDYYVVGMSNIVDLLAGFASSFSGEDYSDISKESIPTEEIYNSMIEQYSEDPGVVKIAEYQNKNGVAGTLFTLEYNEDSTLIETYKESMEISGLDKVYVFLTFDLHMVYICAPIEEAGSMFDSYSYTGIPTVEITEEDIKEKTETFEYSFSL